MHTHIRANCHTCTKQQFLHTPYYFLLCATILHCRSLYFDYFMYTPTMDLAKPAKLLEKDVVAELNNV